MLCKLIINITTELGVLTYLSIDYNLAITIQLIALEIKSIFDPSIIIILIGQRISRSLKINATKVKSYKSTTKI